MTQYELEKNVAISLCESRGENPLAKSNCFGNKFRWQDYLELAINAINAIKYHGYNLDKNDEH